MSRFVLLLLWKAADCWTVSFWAYHGSEVCVCLCAWECMFLCTHVRGWLCAFGSPEEWRASFPGGLVRKEFPLASDAYTTTSSSALWEVSSDLCRYDYFLFKGGMSMRVNLCVYHMHKPPHDGDVVGRRLKAAKERRGFLLSTMCSVSVFCLSSYNHKDSSPEFSQSLWQFLLMVYCLICVDWLIIVSLLWFKQYWQTWTVFIAVINDHTIGAF